jgi:hypothetical protein
MSKVIKPLALTTGMVVSTTATEAHAAWLVGTTYALNARVIVATRIFECIQGPSTGNAPASSPLYWIDVGPSNAWAMFDAEISTQSTAPTALTVVVAPGICNSLALFGLEGHTLSVTVRDGLAGTVVYTRTATLDGTIMADWYQYYFEPSVQRGEVVLSDLPPYANAHITVTVTSAGTAKCGAINMGTFYDLGGAQYGATVGILDFSKKITSAQGVTSFQKGKYSKRVSVRLMLDNSQLNKVQRILSDLRATPCAWIMSDSQALEPLNLLGFYRDFSIDVAYPTMSYCSIEIEGIT